MGVLNHGGRLGFGNVPLFIEGVKESVIRDVLAEAGVDVSDVNFCDDEYGVRLDVGNGVLCEEIHQVLDHKGINVVEGVDFSSGDGDRDGDVGLEDLSGAPGGYRKFVESTLSRVNQRSGGDVRSTLLRRMYGLAGDFQRAGLCEGDGDEDVGLFVESVCSIAWPEGGGVKGVGLSCVNLRDSYEHLSKLPRKVYEKVPRGSKGSGVDRKLFGESKGIYEELDRVLNKQTFLYPVGRYVSREEESCVGLLEHRWGGGTQWFRLSRNKLDLEGATRKDVRAIEESLGLISERASGGVVSIYGVLSYQNNHVRDLLKEMGYRERTEG